MARRALVLGAGGQLGRRVMDVFTARSWVAVGADIMPAGGRPTPFITLGSQTGPVEQSKHLLSELEAVVGTSKLDAVVNVAGGFAMGSASDTEMIAAAKAMIDSSVYSSLLAAHAASVALKPGGLLVLPGAAAALGPTSWSLPYGTAKAAVHHLVRSLAEAESAGLPAGVKTVGIAPQTLDTPQNREAMPDADHATWASLDEVAAQLEAWSSDSSSLASGKVYVIRKSAGCPAVFDPQEPL
eukprot:TRINITY_DN50602_c0_g1_i1.p1 TRINITY_DN50602_c0_g1~~TRINITY_DN50602_c0_g1_i1.p1  ORF type:complete len:241 (-),score=51.59 TRINITY_DN50602_c0_g1_i1:228-950(-)